MAVLPSEFSEFAFGFCVTHQLVNCRVGSLSPLPVRSRALRRHYPMSWWHAAYIRHVLERDFGLNARQSEAVASAAGAPFVPTQTLEKKFPVDMAMNASGIYYFLQFKRSTCVSEPRWNLVEKQELDDDVFDTPFYRVYFGGGKVGKSGKNGDREQRENLERLETALARISAALVRYAAPAFHELAELSDLQANGLLSKIDGRSPVVSFKASAFDIPDNKRHWISFDGVGRSGCRYSTETADVSDILPLVSEINSRAANAPKLFQSISKLRVCLDEFAEDQGLGPRPSELSDQVLLELFGVRPTGESDPETSDAIQFLARSPIGDFDETEIAEGLRKVVFYDGDDAASARESFLSDFYAADYRCRQIMGYPLMVGTSSDAEEFVWEE